MQGARCLVPARPVTLGFYSHNPLPCNANTPRAGLWVRCPGPTSHVPLPPLTGQGQGPPRQSQARAWLGHLTSGDVTKAWVSGFASLRPVKFLL